MTQQFSSPIERDVDTAFDHDETDVREVLREVVADRGGNRVLAEFLGWTVIDV